MSTTNLLKYWQVKTKSFHCVLVAYIEPDHRFEGGICDNFKYLEYG